MSTCSYSSYCQSLYRGKTPCTKFTSRCAEAGPAVTAEKSSLQVAICSMDLEAAERALAWRCDPNEAMPDAINTGSVELVTLLLDHGAQPDAQDGPNPLHMAITRRDVPLVQLLLSRGANVETRYVGMTPLHYCVCVWTPGDTEDRKLELLETLLEHGADVNPTNARGGTPLDDALLANRAKIARWLRAHEGQPTSISLGSDQGAGAADKLIERVGRRSFWKHPLEHLPVPVHTAIALLALGIGTLLMIAAWLLRVHRH